MARLNDLKQRLKQSFENQAEVAGAIGELTEFTTLVTVGTTMSGGALTLPLIIAQSSKAAGALFKLAKIFLADSPSDGAQIDPAKRADEIFYVFAQRAFLRALRKLEGKLPESATLDSSRHADIIRALEPAVIKPDQAEASFQFGWNVKGGPLQLFNSYKAWFLVLLTSMGAKEESANKWLDEVEQEARTNLFKELVSKEKDHQWMVNYQLLSADATIIDLLQGFIDSTSQLSEAAWERYLADLADKPRLPIWGEEAHGLGIDKLFVEPRYTYARNLEDGSHPSPHLPESVPLKNLLTGLLTNRRPSSELVFVMGGPGTGKTSLMEVFCAELAATKKVHLVLVPAKRLDPKKPLLPEIQTYLKAIGHGAVADLLTSTHNCVLAIDGFDELAHATLSTLDDFFRQAQDLVRERNSLGLRIILSGRPTLFSANDVAIPYGSHVLTLNPFDEKRVTTWSQNWREATNGSFEGKIYLHSKSADVRELATQPMLLYLLAKMHESGEPIPHDFKEVGETRFQIYAKILDWVCRRQEEKKITTPSPTVRLRRFLQIAGLATHQSGRRILHWDEFSHALAVAGLAGDPQERHEKVHGTILSFAFSSLEDRAWEFTHKSFGEALAAEAMGRVLEDISEPGRDGEQWRISLPDATKQWVQTFGPHFLTKDVLDFCKGWLLTKGRDFSQRLVPRLTEIYRHLMSSSSEVSQYLAAVAQSSNRSVLPILGNATRSWFSLTNATLALLGDIGNQSKFREWSESIELEHFRSGLYLCNIVSSIASGESRLLFQWTSLLVKGRKIGISKHLLSQIMLLLWRRIDPKVKPRIWDSFMSKVDISSFTVFDFASKNLEKAQLSLLLDERNSSVYESYYTNLARMDNSRFFLLSSLSSSPISLPTPLEELLSDLEDALQYGFEPNLLQELSTKAGVSLDSLLKEPVNADIKKVLKEWIDERIEEAPSSKISLQENLNYEVLKLLITRNI